MTGALLVNSLVNTRFTRAPEVMAILFHVMRQWVLDNLDKKPLTIKQASALPRPNLFLFAIVAKCARLGIWTGFALLFKIT